MLGEKMMRKGCGILAAQVLNHSAGKAFLMEMAFAITACSYVLINAAAHLVVAEFAHGLLTAKLRQLTVDAALAALRLAVDRTADLLNSELLVGILG